MVKLLMNIQWIVSSTLLTKTNELRRHKKLNDLKSTLELDRIAQRQANFMCSVDTLTHLNENNEELADRLENYDLNGNNIGENIARQQIEDIDSVFQVWFSSETHKQNLIGNYSHSGTGTCKSHSGLTYWVQVFYGDNQKYTTPPEYSSSSLIYNQKESESRLPEISIKTLNENNLEKSTSNNTGKHKKQRVEINEPISQIGTKQGNVSSAQSKEKINSDKMHIDIKSPYNKEEFMGLMKNLVQQTVDLVMKKKPDSFKDPPNPTQSVPNPALFKTPYTILPTIPLITSNDINTPPSQNTPIEPRYFNATDDPLIPPIDPKRNPQPKKVADMSINDLQEIMKSVLRETHNPLPSANPKGNPYPLAESIITQAPRNYENQIPTEDRVLPFNTTQNEPNMNEQHMNDEDTHLKLNEYLANLVPKEDPKKSLVGRKNPRSDYTDQLLLKNLLLENIENKSEVSEDSNKKLDMPPQNSLGRNTKSGNTKRLVDFFESLEKPTALNSLPPNRRSKNLQELMNPSRIEKGNTKNLVDFFENKNRPLKKRNDKVTKDTENSYLKSQFNRWLQRKGGDNSEKNSESVIPSRPERENTKTKAPSPAIEKLLKDFLAKTFSNDFTQTGEENEEYSGD